MRDQQHQAAIVLTPTAEFHFRTGRPLTKRLGYGQGLVEAPPGAAVESFAGVVSSFQQCQV